MENWRYRKSLTFPTTFCRCLEMNPTEYIAALFSNRVKMLYNRWRKKFDMFNWFMSRQNCVTNGRTEVVTSVCLSVHVAVGTIQCSHLPSLLTYLFSVRYDSKQTDVYHNNRVKNHETDGNDRHTNQPRTQTYRQIYPTTLDRSSRLSERIPPGAART